MQITRCGHGRAQSSHGSRSPPPISPRYRMDDQTATQPLPSLAPIRQAGGGLGNHPLGPDRAAKPQRTASELLAASSRLDAASSSSASGLTSARWTPRPGPRPPAGLSAYPGKLTALRGLVPGAPAAEPGETPPPTAQLAGAPAAPPVPPSILPSQYHVRELLPVRPDTGAYAAEWDEESEAWQVTVFPAQRPAGREQVGHLRDCLNRMLLVEQQAQAQQQAQAHAAPHAQAHAEATSPSSRPMSQQSRPPSQMGHASGALPFGGLPGGGAATSRLRWDASLPPPADRPPPSSARGRSRGVAEPNLMQMLETASDVDRTYKVVHSIFAAGVHEVARQVSANCAERGQLLIQLWTSAEALRERMLAMKERASEKLETKYSKVNGELAEAVDKLSSMETMESQHLAKGQELVRIVQSRDKLVSMVKTLQAALASVEEQLRTSQAARKAAESQLRTWLPHFEAYSSPAALEALEAHSAATAAAGGVGAPGAPSDSAADLTSRAAEWRESVRAQAVQLADWETPPMLPEAVPLTAESLKMLMNDAGRILGAVVCLGELTKGDDDDDDDEGDGGLKPQAGEAAQYQATIASLQQQLSESKSAQHELQRQLNAVSNEAADAKRSSSRTPRGSVSFSKLPEA